MCSLSWRACLAIVGIEDWIWMEDSAPLSGEIWGLDCEMREDEKVSSPIFRSWAYEIIGFRIIKSSLRAERGWLWHETKNSWLLKRMQEAGIEQREDPFSNTISRASIGSKAINFSSPAPQTTVKRKTNVIEKPEKNSQKKTEDHARPRTKKAAHCHSPHCINSQCTVAQTGKHRQRLFYS